MKRLMAVMVLLGTVGSVAQAGAIGGPKVSQSVVLPGSTDRYVVGFRAGETAVVVVRGDGDTDLDLYVYDENGNLITSDDDGSDDCVVQWTPMWSGKFTIRIVNRGSLGNRYRVATN
jgi:hypothetical protein